MGAAHDECMRAGRYCRQCRALVERQDLHEAFKCLVARAEAELKENGHEADTSYDVTGHDPDTQLEVRKALDDMTRAWRALCCVIPCHPVMQVLPEMLDQLENDTNCPDSAWSREFMRRVRALLGDPAVDPKET